MTIDIRVYFDSCCFIDLAKTSLNLHTESGRTDHIFYCKKLLDAARKKELVVLTSILTLSECTHVKDKSKFKTEQAIRTDEVKRLFHGMVMSGRSGVLPVQPTPLVVEKARDLVWTHGTSLKAMDAIHVATAIVNKCNYFLTTDNLGKENIEIINGLGLSVCSAGQISHLLPDHYKQMDL
ncbi:PIN_MT3492-like domain containing protein [Methylophilaceae bacterium]